MDTETWNYPWSLRWWQPAGRCRNREQLARQWHAAEARGGDLTRDAPAPTFIVPSAAAIRSCKYIHDMVFDRVRAQSLGVGTVTKLGFFFWWKQSVAFTPTLNSHMVWYVFPTSLLWALYHTCMRRVLLSRLDKLVNKWSDVQLHARLMPTVQGKLLRW
jgi:hypothetical protein